MPADRMTHRGASSVKLSAHSLGRAIATSILEVHWSKKPNISTLLETALQLRSVLDFEADVSYNPLRNPLFRPAEFRNKHPDSTRHGTIYDVLRLIGDAPSFVDIKNALTEIEADCSAVGRISKYLFYMQLAGWPDFGINQASYFFHEVEASRQGQAKVGGKNPNSASWERPGGTCTRSGDLRSDFRIRGLFRKYISVANLCFGLNAVGITLVDLWDGNAPAPLVEKALALGLTAQSALRAVTPSHSHLRRSASGNVLPHINTAGMKYTHTPSLRMRGIKDVPPSACIFFDGREQLMLSRIHPKYYNLRLFSQLGKRTV